MNKYISLFLLILFGSCSINKHNIIHGVYQYQGVYGVNYLLELDTNNTFQFIWKNGLSHGEVNGIWKNENNNVVLIGGKSSPIKKIMVEENSQGNPDSVYIEIIDFKNQPLDGSLVIINKGQITGISDINGKLNILKSNNFNTILIKDIRVKNDQKYNIKNTSSNHFIFRLYTSLDYDIYFDQVKLKMNGNKIIMKKNPFSIKKQKMIFIRTEDK